MKKEDYLGYDIVKIIFRSNDNGLNWELEQKTNQHNAGFINLIIINNQYSNNERLIF